MGLFNWLKKDPEIKKAEFTRSLKALLLKKALRKNVLKSFVKNGIKHR